MKAGIPRSLDRKLELANRIDSVNYFVPSDRPDDLLGWDFWLGNSRDGQVWGLFATAVQYLDDEQEDGVRPDQLVAYLLDPTKRNTQTIGDILLAVHQVRTQGSLVRWNLPTTKTAPFRKCCATSCRRVMALSPPAAIRPSRRTNGRSTPVYEAADRWSPLDQQQWVE